MGQGTQFSWEGDPRRIRGAHRSERSPQPVDEINGVLSDMAILGPSMNNEFRAGYNRRGLVQRRPRRRIRTGRKNSAFPT